MHLQGRRYRHVSMVTGWWEIVLEIICEIKHHNSQDLRTAVQDHQKYIVHLSSLFRIQICNITQIQWALYAYTCIHTCKHTYISKNTATGESSLLTFKNRKITHPPPWSSLSGPHVMHQNTSPLHLELIINYCTFTQ